MLIKQETKLVKRIKALLLKMPFKAGQLVGKAYDGLKELKSNVDGKVKNSATKFVEKYGDDNFFGKLADDIVFTITAILILRI